MKKYRLRQSLEIDHFLDGEDVIFDIKNETIYVLNYAASIALQVRLIYNDASYLPVAEFKEAILANLVDVNESELQKDFEEAMRILLQKELIEIYEE